MHYVHFIFYLYIIHLTILHESSSPMLSSTVPLNTFPKFLRSQCDISVVGVNLELSSKVDVPLNKETNARIVLPRLESSVCLTH